MKNQPSRYAISTAKGTYIARKMRLLLNSIKTRATRKRLKRGLAWVKETRKEILTKTTRIGRLMGAVADGGEVEPFSVT